jgi:restriction system protein
MWVAGLGAQVSTRPAEAQPVKPLVEFEIVDRRFVDQSDVLSDLEAGIIFPDD